MSTLFQQAPFARFDLGKHILGQKKAQGPPCPVGTVPFRYPNGAIVCSKANPASGMFMSPTPYGNVAYGMAGRMGQMEDPYLTQMERDQLLAQIQSAVKNVKPLDDMIVWSQDNDPQLKNMLGGDWTRFWALSNSIAPLYKTVKPVAERLAEPGADYWYRPNPEEYAAIKQWTTGVNEMYKILQAHKTPAKPLPVTSVPPPSTMPAGGVSKLPTGGPLTSTGFTTTEYVVAAGAAIGLGALIYALVG